MKGLMSMRSPILLVGLLVLGAAAQAQEMASIVTRDASARAGEPVHIRMLFGVKGPIGCGVRLDWGDGTPPSHQEVHKAGDIPMVASHVYARPGNYRLVALGDGHAAVPACSGYEQHAYFAVAAAAAPAKKRAAGAPSS